MWSSFTSFCCRFIISYSTLFSGPSWNIIAIYCTRFERANKRENENCWQIFIRFCAQLDDLGRKLIKFIISGAHRKHIFEGIYFSVLCFTKKRELDNRKLKINSVKCLMGKLRKKLWNYFRIPDDISSNLLGILHVLKV